MGARVTNHDEEASDCPAIRALTASLTKIFTSGLTIDWTTFTSSFTGNLRARGGKRPSRYFVAPFQIHLPLSGQNIKTSGQASTLSLLLSGFTRPISLTKAHARARTLEAPLKCACRKAWLSAE